MPEAPGAGRAKLRLSRGFPRRIRPRGHPPQIIRANPPRESRPFGVVKQKMRDAKVQHLSGG
jgi:hypothetical protein